MLTACFCQAKNVLRTRLNCRFIQIKYILSESYIILDLNQNARMPEGTGIVPDRIERILVSNDETI
jgi:hypothetical protein